MSELAPQGCRVAQSLRAHRFFDGMASEHIDLLRRVAHEVRFGDGERVFEQGAPASVAYFIVAGRVALRAVGPCGAAIDLAELGAGEVLGELSLIEDHRRSASATARGELVVLTVDRSDLAALCAHNHPVSLELLHRLALLLGERIRTSNSGMGHQLRRCSRDEGERKGLSPQLAGASFDVRRFLPVLPFFQRFTARNLDNFMRLCTVWTVPRGRQITGPGDTRGSCFVVVRGAAEAVAHRGDKSFRYAVLGPGTLFGELAWLLDEPRSAEVRSRETCTLLELPREQLPGLVDPDCPLSFRFHESLVRSLMAQLGAQTRALTRTEHREVAGVRVWQPLG